ncbi:hypothetical protein ACVWZK_003403 [Bradyrhizobium sp. GM0.4]
MSAVTPAKPAEKPAEPWRQRLIRSLLYGRNVDRAAKARARVGLAMLAFGAVYALIGGRLVMFAIGADAHGARRAAAQEVVATARPDIVDRNGAILATDVKASSLFGEPRRIIDKDEAIELLTATVPDLDEAEVRERLKTRKGFVWLKREITAKQQQDIHKLGIPGIGFLRENKRVYPTGNEVAHLIGLVNIDNQGIAGMEKWLDNQGLADLHRAGFATDRLQKPIELSVDLRVEHALRDELLKAKEKYHTKAASGIVSNVKTGEIVAMVSLPDFDPNNPKEAHDPRPHQSPDHRRLRDGLDLQGVHAGDGARFRQDQSEHIVGCTRKPALRQVHHPRQPSARTLHQHQGSVHLLVQHRRGADRARPGRRGPQGIPRQDGPVDAAAHRTAGKRGSADSAPLGRAEHGHHRFRPGHVGGAAAGGDGHQRAGERRLFDSADLHEAQRVRSGGDGPSASSGRRPATRCGS